MNTTTVNVYGVGQDETGAMVTAFAEAFDVRTAVLRGIKDPTNLASVLWELAYDAGIVPTIHIPGTYRFLMGDGQILFFDVDAGMIRANFTWGSGNADAHTGCISCDCGAKAEAGTKP